jgi:two-component system nitrogen regulation sensor histidine kinase GlnL
LRGLFIALIEAMKTMNIGELDSSSILEQQTTAIVCLDPQLRIVYMNTAAEILFSVTARKTIGQDIHSSLFTAEKLDEQLRDVLHNERTYTEREVSLWRPGLENPPTVDLTISAVLLKAQQHGLMIELQHIDQQVRLARGNSMLSRQAFSRDLLRGLAHEIKNPLGGLRGAAQLLEKELADPSLHEYTDIIIREADRLHSLIDRMLGPNSRPKPACVNIHEILQYVRKITEAEAPSGVQIYSDYDPSIPDFNVDRDHFVQVFLNLIGNALNALNGQGNIVLRTRIQRYLTIGNKLHRLVGCFEIKDDGPGIPDNIKDSLFYPMISGRPEGTGLGLSIAQTLVNQHGGLIEHHSKPGSTVFTVLIPLDT